MNKDQEQEEWFPIGTDGALGMMGLLGVEYSVAAPTRLSRVSRYCRTVDLSNAIKKGLRGSRRLKISVA